MSGIADLDIRREAFSNTRIQSLRMSNLWSLKKYLACGFKREDLKTANLEIRAANTNRLNIIGEFEATVQGQSPSGNVISSSSKVFVSDSVNDFFLSFDTMLDLGILGNAFPTVGSNTPEVSKKNTLIESMT